MTFCIKYATFFVQKSCDEDTRPGKIPREDAILVQGGRNPAGEIPLLSCMCGNAIPGAPVTVPMSDGCCRNQGGTVEYFVSHP